MRRLGNLLLPAFLLPAFLLPAFLFLALLGQLQAQSQDKAPGELKRLQEKFKTVNSLTADFHQSFTQSSGKKGGGLKGRLFYQKDNRYRIELKNTVIVSDGSTLWNYNRGQKKLIINDLQNESPAFSLNNIIYTYPSQSSVELLGKEVIDGKECSIIRLTAKDGESNFRSARIWIDEESLLKKIELRDASGSLQTYELSGVKINQNIPSERFTFKAPEGSEVIDLR